MRVVGIPVLLLAVVAMVLAGCGSSAPEHRRWYPNGGPPRDENWHSAVSMLTKYDADKDGTLTRSELNKGLKAEFDIADAHHAGCLDPDEVRAINEERAKSDESAASPLIDWKSKGCVDFDEYATMARSLFDQLDVDGDGQLSPKELQPRKRRKPTVATPPNALGPGGY